jgi:hypothetical protein
LSKLALFIPLILVHAQRALAIPVDPSELERAIAERRKLIPEFSQIANEAEKRGFRVFLAGGLAASYGDFVKHQVLAEQGKETIQSARLANISSNVVLPEQDYDLVLTRADGKAESAEDLSKFKSWLETKMPKTLEGMSKWDVIGLKTTVGKHIAVEGDPDFASQNNDSLSIGLIELTTPPDGKSVISEAHHMAKPSGKSVFLNDIAGDGITFLESPMHHQTAKAAAGNNPEILGAIRFLNKSLQFNKEISRDQYRRIERIISSFDPKSLAPGSYPYNWIQKRGKHLLNHAYDPNEAIRILDQLGLRKKLMELGGSSNRVGSLAWWLNKEPLPLHPVGSAPAGANTAGELGIKQVAHETHDFAHRLISWRYDALPRAFVSREGQLGETAHYGKGFYTANGNNASSFSKAAQGSTIVFNVDPSAMEGRDFIQLEDNPNGVRWLNGSKLSVRQETREYSPSVCITQQLTQLTIVPRPGSFPIVPKIDKVLAAIIGGEAYLVVSGKLSKKSIQNSLNAGDVNSSKNDASSTEQKSCQKELRSAYVQDAKNFCDWDPTQDQINLLKKMSLHVRAKGWRWSEDTSNDVLSMRSNLSLNCLDKAIGTDYLNPSNSQVLNFCKRADGLQSEALSRIATHVRARGLSWSDDALEYIKWIDHDSALTCIDQVIGTNYFNPSNSDILSFCRRADGLQSEALSRIATHVRARGLPWSDDAFENIKWIDDNLSLSCIDKVIGTNYFNPSNYEVLKFCRRASSKQSDALSKIATNMRVKALPWSNDAFENILRLYDDDSLSCIDKVIGTNYFNPSNSKVLNFCSRAYSEQADGLSKIATHLRAKGLPWNDDTFDEIRSMDKSQIDCAVNELSRGSGLDVALKRCH